MFKVLDTNILLLDANNLLSLSSDGATIVLPETVLDEIDSKKSGLNELAYQAREFGRILSKAAKVSSHLVEDLNVTVLKHESTVIHVVSLSCYPDYKDSASNIVNDRKIIEIALRYNKIYSDDDVVFISNDVMCRLRADSLSLSTQDLKEVENTNFEFTKCMDIPYNLFTNLQDASIMLVNPDHKPENYNYQFTSKSSTNEVKFAYINASGNIKIIGKRTSEEIRDHKRQPAPPINSEQLMLSRAILDTSIDLVVCEAKAGSGFN